VTPSPAGTFAVRAHNLFAGYDGDAVLRGVSLDLEAGSIGGLCGPNGAGKSTFIKLCLGLLKPRSGSITVLGKRPGAGFRKTLFRIGYVPQNAAGGLLPVTVREAVSMGRYGRAGLFRPLSRRDWELTGAAMEAAGIGNLAGRRVQELSGGELQRTAIARALAMESELLLLDEPTSSLDAQGRVELLRIIKERGAYRHITALIVSHDEATLAECAPLYRLSRGVLA
jgi:ABC-type Mn2+/Zn2+ transport system ATPase subunit